ncbi:hypothetical protein [Brachyspira pulli]|uniref:hypothetical protein n=1 Tax=Brachyspira pulli TaxID=310721 RepID=UPI002618195F|nr:hypothetical protein [uncultured Brachyspira sp.]
MNKKPFLIKRNRKHKKFYKKLLHKKHTIKKFIYKLKEKRKRRVATGSIYKKSRHKRKDKLEIDIPKVLSFDENTCETLVFFNKIREISDNKKRLFINMKYLTYITPEAALVLVSELDRLCTLHKTRIGVYDFNKWNNEIKTIFNDIGMYDFLDIKLSRKEKGYITPNNNNTIRYLKFKSGTSGNEGRKLQIVNEIESLINENSINGKKTLKVGITEAILNTHHHAYPDDFIYNSIYKLKKWWILGYININDNNMKIIIYDQGKTIPKTLDLKRYVIFNKNDAEKIRIAVETSESSTKLENRGKGLKSIKKYAKKSDNGELVIISRKGYYKYTKNSDDIESKLLDYNLQGTLISWNGCIKSEIDIDETLYEEE